MLRNFFTLMFSAFLTATTYADNTLASQGANTEVPIKGMQEVRTETLSGLDEIVRKGIDEETYPGAVLIVGQPEKVLWAAAYGRHTYEETSEENSLESIFDLASVSKVVGTTSGALILMEDGKLSESDLVGKYIEGFNTNGKESVVIRDLMTHTSGLKAYESYSKVDEEKEEGTSNPDALISHYAALPVRYTPREDYTYSCLNFQTTARVVEEASEMNLEDLLRLKVFGPLKMSDTVYNLDEEQKSRAVPTQMREDGSIIVAEVHDPLASYHKSNLGHCPGNAGLFSTGPDLARYCETIASGGTFRGEKVFSSSVLEDATRDRTPEMVSQTRGLGFDIYDSFPYANPENDDPQKGSIGHSGYTGTLIWIDKDSQTYIVFLTNRTWPDDAGKQKDEWSISDARKAVIEEVVTTLLGWSEKEEEETASGV